MGDIRLRVRHEIVALAWELGAGLVVLGAGGKGPVRRYLVGDVAESVFRRAPCPVLTMRENGSEET